MSSPSGRPGDKRKRDDSPFSPAQPSKKKGKKDEDAEMSSENEYEPAGGQQQDQQSDLTGAMNRIGLRSTPPTSSLGEEEDVEMEEEETSEQEQSEGADDEASDGDSNDNEDDNDDNAEVKSEDDSSDYGSSTQYFNSTPGDYSDHSEEPDSGEEGDDEDEDDANEGEEGSDDDANDETLPDEEDAAEAAESSPVEDDSDEDVENLASFLDQTEVLSPSEYVHRVPGQKDYVDITDPAHRCRQISAAELSSAGHNASHIKIINHLQDRGFEALLPSAWFEDFRWLPRVLFSQSYDGDKEPAGCPPVPIRSIRNMHPGGFNMLRRFMELGQYVREAAARLEDPNNYNPTTGKLGKYIKRPEQKAREMIGVVEKWTRRDSDMRTQLSDQVFPPLLAYVVKPANTTDEELEPEVDAKMRAIIEQYKRNFVVADSVETAASSSPQFLIELPTAYCLVLKNTIVALTAMRAPPDGESDPGNAEVLFMLDLAAPAHDVWNVLAICLVLCCLRDVRVGLKTQLGWVDDSPEEVDVDL